MILDGNKVALKIYQDINQRIKKLDFKPCLAVVLAGENLANTIFIQAKEEIVKKLGFDFKLFHLPRVVSQKKVEELIFELNQNLNIQGIVVQLPLPEGFKTREILSKISPDKDVDGFSGRYPAPTAQAILEILKFYDVDYSNKKIIIVGHGILVGQPLEKMLLEEGVRPIICDLKTRNLSRETQAAEILISAAGVPGMIKENMVALEAIVIDAGTSENLGRIKGDVEREVYKKVAAYTPVPGGVGPVTVACLMKNLVQAAEEQRS